MSSGSPNPGDGAFPPTRWTLIRSAQASPELRQQALRELLQAYWQPIYIFVRHKGVDAQSARDVVQDLVVQLLERDFLDRLQPEKGRLRSYLRAAAEHALANRHAETMAQKRGGGAVTIELDFELAERLAGEGSPEDSFEREWAIAVMDRAMKRLREEYTSGQRKAPFELILQFFRPGELPSYKDAAAAHGMSLPQLKTVLHRARTRFRELVREEVAETVIDGQDVDAELADLQRVLAQ